MTTTTTGTRIPLADMERIIEAAMAGLDLQHDSSWVRPPECPCHHLGTSCLLPPEEGGCQGYAAEIDTPEAHQVTAGHLLAALPVPDNDGTVDAAEAALSVMSVIEQRLSYPYTLRFHKLRDRLVAASEKYEQSAGLTDTGVPDSGSDDITGSLPVRHCQRCGTRYSPQRESSRYCDRNCRQAAYRSRQAAGQSTELRAGCRVASPAALCQPALHVYQVPAGQ